MNTLTLLPDTPQWAVIALLSHLSGVGRRVECLHGESSVTCATAAEQTTSEVA